MSESQTSDPPTTSSASITPLIELNHPSNNTNTSSVTPSQLTSAVSANLTTGAPAAGGLVYSGWIVKKNAGLLSNQSRKMYGRLKLGSGSVGVGGGGTGTAVAASTIESATTLICTESDQPHATIVGQVNLDASMTIKFEPQLFQWTLKTRGSGMTNLTTFTPPVSMQQLTGITWIFQCPTAIEFEAWQQAWKKVQTQLNQWDQQRKEREIQRLEKEKQLTAIHAATVANRRQAPTAKTVSQHGPITASPVAPSLTPSHPPPSTAPNPILTPTNVGSTSDRTEPTLLSSANELKSIPQDEPIIPSLVADDIKLLTPELKSSTDDSIERLIADASNSPEPLIRLDPSLVPHTPSDEETDTNQEGAIQPHHQPEHQQEAQLSPPPPITPIATSPIAELSLTSTATTTDPTLPIPSLDERKTSSESNTANLTQEIEALSQLILTETSESTSAEVGGATTSSMGDSSSPITHSVQDVPLTPINELSTSNGAFVAPVPTPSPTSALAAPQQQQGTLDFSSAGGGSNDFSSISSNSFTFDSPTLASATPRSLPPASPSMLALSASTSPAMNALTSINSGGSRSSSATSDLSLLTSTSTNAATIAAAEAAKKKELARVKAEEKRLIESKQMRTMKNRMYQKLFNLSVQEELIEDYSCAIKKSILLHGRMYISWNHICFFSSIFSHKTVLILQMSDILYCTPASVALLFDNSIRMYVQTGPLPIPKINSAGQIVPLPGAPIVNISTTIAASTATAASGVSEPKTLTGSISPSPINASTPSPSAPLSITVPTLTVTSVMDGSVHSSPTNSESVNSQLSSSSASAISSSNESVSPMASTNPNDPQSTIPNLRTPSPAFAAVPTPRESQLNTTNNLDIDLTTPTIASTTDLPITATSTTTSSTSLDASTSSTLLPDPTSESYTEPIALTSNASMDLNQQQLQYLVAINHSNIAVHFFASFLMRDHCLALIDGILKRRRESNPNWVKMQQAWKQADDRRAAIMADRLAAKKAEEAAALALLTPPASPLIRDSSSPPIRPTIDDTAIELTTFSTTFVPSPEPIITDSSRTSTSPSATISEPPHPRKDHHGHHGKKHLQHHRPPHTTHETTATSSEPTSSGSTTSTAISSIPTPPSFQLIPRIDFGPLAPPVDDFTKMEWENIVDLQFPIITARAFFSLFLSDSPALGLVQYSLLSPKNDSDWLISSWYDLSTNLPVSGGDSHSPKFGPWVRDASYKKVIPNSPLGPPQTRVHSQAIYTATENQVQVETRNVTPDTPFGDCMHVLERLIIMDSPITGGGCRIRVQVGVRFTKQPWKMKMFVGLIKSRTKEDVQNWYQSWLQALKSWINNNTELVQTTIGRELGTSSLPIMLPSIIDDMPPQLPPGSDLLSPLAPPDNNANEFNTPLAPYDSASSVSFSDSLFSHPPHTHLTNDTHPLPEWSWLRRGLLSIPIPLVSAHTDSIMATIGTIRQQFRHYSTSELLSLFLVILAIISFLSIETTDLSWFGLLCTIILPWRWLRLILGSTNSPIILLLISLICLITHQQHETNRRHQLLSEQIQRLGHQHQQQQQHQMTRMKQEGKRD